MNAIILSLAMISQLPELDMSKRQEPPARIQAPLLLDLSGYSTKHLDMSVAPKKRALHLYSIPGCPFCPAAISDVKTLVGEFDVVIHEDPSEFPDFILRQASKKDWGYPLVHWELKDKTGMFAVWPGLASFRQSDGAIKEAAFAAAESQEEAAARPTPTQEVERVLGLLPKPAVGFVDFGCGDARWCIAAAERWGCRVTGVEIDPARASAARERVKSVGLSHLVTIVTGDATKTDVSADVGVAYLYGDVLEKLRPRIEKLQAFASYMHRPPGLPVIQSGSTWIYNKPAMQVRQAAAVWGGQYYSQPVCNDPRCGMCNSIRQQLGSGQMQSQQGSFWSLIFKE